jgi:tetratricopeptide (TPR) repeat protein
MERLTLWQDTASYLRDRGLPGTALGTFEQYYPAYKTFPGPRTARYAHNEYLQLVCELGLIGAALLSVFVRQVVPGLWAQRLKRPAAVAALCVAAFWALLDFSWHGDFILYSTALLLGTVLPAPDPASRRGAPDGWATTACALAGVLTLAVAITQGTALAFHQTGKAHLKRGEASLALLQFQTASRLNPWDAHFLEDQATCLFELNQDKEAVQKVEKALSIKPRSVWTRRRLALILAESSQFSEALSTYAPVLQLAPRVPRFWTEMGHLWKQAERLSEAEKFYRTAAELKRQGY